MKVQNISTIPFLKRNIDNSQREKAVAFSTQPVLQDTVSFKRQPELTPEQKFERAMDIVSCFSHDQIMHMDDFDQGHLEGIQYGLKSFEGMNFKEIYFLLSNMNELCVPLIRDCAGMCPVCAVNGLPKDRSADNMIHKTDFEDFSNFTHDLKSIRERLGFDMEENAMSKQPPWAGMFGYKPVVFLFYDSDCKDIVLEDKDGKIHEFPELNKMLFDATKMKGIFDTAGWSRTNAKVQKRMEALADYYSKPEHQKEIEQINISFNTYHGIMEKANQFKNKGDIDGYNRLRAIYVKNIANAMYTFTPLIDFNAYQILLKAFDDNDDSQFADYKTPVLEELMQDVFEALEKRYKEDLDNNNYKFVSNNQDISVLMSKIKSKSDDITTQFIPSARNNMFSKISVDENKYFQKNTPVNEVLNGANMLVDMNGKIYFRSDFEVFATDKSFNFKNKDKKTKQIYPEPAEKIISVKNRDFIDSEE